MPLDAPVTTHTPAGVMFDYACTGRELDILLPQTSGDDAVYENPLCVTACASPRNVR
jgi:hypothetical protein